MPIRKGLIPKAEAIPIEYVMIITHSEDSLCALQIQRCQTPMRHSIYHAFDVFFQLWPPEIFLKVNLKWRGIPPVRVRV